MAYDNLFKFLILHLFKLSKYYNAQFGNILEKKNFFEGKLPFFKFQIEIEPENGEIVFQKQTLFGTLTFLLLNNVLI